MHTHQAKDLSNFMRYKRLYRKCRIAFSELTNKEIYFKTEGYEHMKSVSRSMYLQLSFVLSQTWPHNKLEMATFTYLNFSKTNTK